MQWTSGSSEEPGGAKKKKKERKKTSAASAQHNRSLSSDKEHMNQFGAPSDRKQAQRGQRSDSEFFEFLSR